MLSTLLATQSVSLRFSKFILNHNKELVKKSKLRPKISLIQLDLVPSFIIAIISCVGSATRDTQKLQASLGAIIKFLD
jgi:hypothetical protein